MNKNNNSRNRDQKKNYANNSKKKVYRGKNQHSNSKSASKDIAQDTTSDVSGDINNPAYYYESGTVLDQVMNFSFNQYGDVPVEIVTDPFTNPGRALIGYNPMIMIAHVNPSMPTGQGSSGGTDGVTTAALRNFMTLTATNNRSIPYGPQDLFILQLALSDLLSTSSCLTRDFGLAWLFNYRNRTYPEKIYLSRGIDFDDFSKNLADYRVRYNRLLTMASKIPFPANIPAFVKSADFYSGIYLDDDNSALAQTYMLVPETIWIFNEAYDTNGAGLETHTFCDGTVHTFDWYLDLFEAQISALLNSTSLNYIYSDILRLQQKGQMNTLLQFNPIPETYVVIPKYNSEIKDWLHNSVVLGSPLSTANQHTYGNYVYTNQNDVCCDAGNNKINYRPQFILDDGIGFSVILDFDHDNVSVEDKVRATRFSNAVCPAEDNGTWFSFDVALSDHYIVRWRVYNGGTTFLSFAKSFHKSTSHALSLTYLSAISKFDWHPLLYWWTGNDPTLAVIEGDLDFYTVVDYYLLRRIYDYEVIHYYQIG